MGTTAGGGRGGSLLSGVEVAKRQRLSARAGTSAPMKKVPLLCLCAHRLGRYLLIIGSTLRPRSLRATRTGRSEETVRGGVV